MSRRIFPRLANLQRLLLVAVLCILGGPARSAPDVTAEEVKAAFLYQIARYVEWPSGAFPRADTPVTIAVLGAEPLAAELSRVVMGRTAHDRPIVVQRLKDFGSLTGMHMVFIGRDHRAHLPELAPRARERGVLVVTEWESALSTGGMVNFVIVGGRVRFEVALDTTLRSGIKLSSRLLSVAQQVHLGGY
ncbi:MAG: YfiR family protein [Betaproteobacteria bacterium]